MCDISLKIMNKYKARTIINMQRLVVDFCLL